MSAAPVDASVWNTTKCVRASGVFQRVRPLLGGPVEEVPSLHQAERRCARHRVSAQAWRLWSSRSCVLDIWGFFFLPDVCFLFFTGTSKVECWWDSQTAPWRSSTEGSVRRKHCSNTQSNLLHRRFQNTLFCLELKVQRCTRSILIYLNPHRGHHL